MSVNLRAERLNRGWTLADAAEKFGVSIPTISNMENGTRPNPRLAFDVASEFGHKVTDIWPVDDPPSERVA